MEESLAHTVNALEHDEYATPYVFKRMDAMKGDEFSTNGPLEAILNQCIVKNLGFDPNLALQHIEKEALEQFNKLVLQHVTGQSIKTLMEMRHALELFMLKDRKVHYTKEIEIAVAEIMKLVEEINLELGPLEPIIPINSLADKVNLIAKNKKK